MAYGISVARAHTRLIGIALYPPVRHSYAPWQPSNASRVARNLQMQFPTATFSAAAVRRCPIWVKRAATATFLLVFLKGSVWLGTIWLAMRGFHGF